VWVCHGSAGGQLAWLAWRATAGAGTPPPLSPRGDGGGGAYPVRLLSAGGAATSLQAGLLPAVPWQTFCAGWTCLRAAPARRRQLTSL